MNPQVKNLWLEALRSGSYEQARNELYNSDEGYCCLGVLTDIYMGQHGYDKNYYVNEMIRHSYGGANMLPSKEVQNWAGLTDHDQVELATRNDDGDSFQQIANYIEERL